MMLKMRNGLKRKKKGFTLIELIIVIAIIAILAAMIVPSLMGTKSKAQLSTNRQSVREITNALQEYFAENDEYPATPTNADDLFKSGGALEDAFDGEVPTYKNGTSIVATYTQEASKSDYKIYLKDDTGTSNFDESKILKSNYPASGTPTMVAGTASVTGYFSRKYKYDKLFK